MPNGQYYLADCPECDWKYIGAGTKDEAADEALRHYHTNGRPHHATVTPLTKV